MSEKRSIIRTLPFAVVLAALFAAAASKWTPGAPGVTFWAAACISLILMIPSLLLWTWGGRGRTLVMMMLAAFSLRFAFGLATVNLLPTYGHPNEQREQLGFLFDDAWRRDEEAWAVSHQEDVSFSESLTREYRNDQYGALSAMSLWLYRYISPDARRYTLIMLVGAFVSALGVPFLWRALDDRWGRRICLIGCWIYVLYPDSIFFSGSPMREPFLIGIICAAFWALSTVREHKRSSWIVLAVSILVCLPFSTLVAVILAGAASAWIWAELLIPRSKVWLWTGIILGSLAVLAAVIVFLPAFNEWIHFDIYTTENKSGWVEKVVGEIGAQFRSVFLAFYGLTQPVLPAILVYPTAPACDLAAGTCTTIYWKVAGIYRAAGWYILVPFLFYAIFSSVRVKDKKERGLMVVNGVFILVWIFLSSLRAGGDQIDNPRYRMIFLPWLAFMAAWGIDYALKIRDWWLVRWITVELIFLWFFTQWYVSRYSGNAIRRFPFWKTVIYILICSAAVFATGLISPLRRKFEKKEERSFTIEK